MTQVKGTVGVVGTGLMGTEIAFVAACAGHRVLLSDRTEDALSAAIARMETIYDRGVARGIHDAGEKAVTLGRVQPGRDLQAYRECEIVTEAVFEQEDVKAEVLRDLAQHCRADCVIASNTSTIPISVLASYLPQERRARFVGTHYFSPVSRMKLVEVIPGLETARATLDLATRFLTGLGKAPIRIKDVPGFAVNRLLHAFMIEAVRLVEEGVASPEDIDVACRLGLGHPMGPFELMDATTSSLCLQAQEIMFAAYGERFRPRPLLKQRVRAGYVGGKGRKGWRTH